MRRALSLWLVAAPAACSSAPTSPPAAREGPQELGERGPVAAPQRSPLVEPPGALLADVTQADIQTTICVSGWTATVRPSTSFTQHVKQLMLARAGLQPADATAYELDHFVPLALGGSARSEDNLWLQSWVGEWSARIKDRLGETLCHLYQAPIDRRIFRFRGTADLPSLRSHRNPGRRLAGGLQPVTSSTMLSMRCMMARFGVRVT